MNYPILFTKKIYNDLEVTPVINFDKEVFLENIYNIYSLAR